VPFPRYCGGEEEEEKW
jgi:hypothetical protein